MSLWFLDDQARLARERAAVEQLHRSAEWLVGLEWSLGAGLDLDVVIRAHDHDYEVKLQYPALFPEVPPTVCPRNAEENWSAHQYGNAGPLCLEWGPDNWHPEVTGAQVLESAYKLLNLENPLGRESSDALVHAPSRHALTVGQELRGRRARFYVSGKALEHLSTLPAGASGVCRFSTSWHADGSRLDVVHELRLVDEQEPWVDPTIPQFLRGRSDAAIVSGIFFKTEFDPAQIDATTDLEHLATLLRNAGHPTEALASDPAPNSMGMEKCPSGALILDRDGLPHFFNVFGEGRTLKLAAVHSARNAAAPRTPDNLRGLSGKSIGVVGLGSAGSKIATSLARMGVKRFYLVDHDIFLPENVERHVLDWSDIGTHKVDAIRDALLRLGVAVEIETARTHLTGQESTAVVSSVLNKLGDCDLLIDATASQGVFNLMAAIAKTYRKPLVWMEVYGGGSGGMVARSRPQHDPAAQTMRAAYLDYCQQNPAPELQGATDYAIEDDQGGVLIASDADVAIIAHHAARIAADTMIEREPSAYPYSMYLIGLDRWWVFEAPFATIPIATDHLILSEREAAEQAAKATKEQVGDNYEFINSLVQKLRATPPPT